jgi:peroxiredoxin
MNFNITVIKSLFIFAIFSFFSTGCNATGIKINGEFSNMDSHKYVYLYSYFGPDFTKIDSTLQQKGVFVFTYKKPLPRGFYRIGVDNTLSALIILGNESPSLKGDLNNLAGTLEITNSKENELYKSFIKFNDNMNAAGNKIQTEAQGLMGLRTSDTVKFNSEIRKLQGRLDSINNLKKKFYTEFKTENKNLFVSKLADVFESNESATKETFFSESILKDPELVRGDLIATKLTMFLQRFAPNSLQEAEAVAKEVLTKPWIPESKEVIYITIIKLFFQYDQDYSRSIASMYGKEFPNSKHAKKLLSELPQGTPALGEKAPNISLADTTGKIISLSSLKGKVVLIDFWASWCRPCRMENPNVVKAYEKYKDAGFTVYSVSLDENKSSWAQAIKKDNLKWNSHVSDLKGWQSSAAKLYGVTGIPATFLIDRDGNLIGKNLRGESLEAKLEEVCTKK